MPSGPKDMACARGKRGKAASNHSKSIDFDMKKFGLRPKPVGLLQPGTWL